jgi:phosphomannomutase
LAKSEKVDIGFAHDADADRLALVTEQGRILPEDYSLLLAAKFTLTGKRGLIVTNLSTTRALDEVAEQFNCPVERTRIGDIHVSRCMKEKGAVIGGEGNGGVILPQIHYARDGIAAIALLLEYLAETKKPISELAGSLPYYCMIKRKLKTTGEDFPSLKSRLKKEFPRGRFSFLDGVKVDLGKSWIHIRRSGTEPVIRIITEAKTRREAEGLYQLASSFLERA